MYREWWNKKDEKNFITKEKFLELQKKPRKSKLLKLVKERKWCLDRTILISRNLRFSNNPK